jgi:cytochrome oxidase Cu insertion factor (SCO1/SenC/PrrC family)
MSKTVKMWLSLLLMVLAAYTLYTMIRISDKIREGDVPAAARPGVSVAESSGSTSVSENGGTDTYELSLQTVPTAAVEITVSADPQSEVSIDGVNFASTAVFSRTDTTAQTVTVRAVDDSSEEGRHTSTISHAITNSGDTTNYPTSMTIDSVTAIVADNDVPIDLEKFEMTSQQAEAFPFKELEGQVWIASLFFSSCPHECKSLNTAIASLNRDPEFKDVKFVSISVDPQVDSPQTLAEYARLFDADPAKWLFLTGDLQQIGRFGRAIDVPAGYKTHTKRLALIDRDGKVRGQYRYNDAAEIAQLRADLPAILAEKTSDVETEDVESKTDKQSEASSGASVPKGEDRSP